MMTKKTTKIDRPRLKPGDLVRIKEGTHDSRLPDSRLGILMYEYKAVLPYTDREPQNTGCWMILFTNGELLHFHEYYIVRHTHKKQKH